MKTDPIVERVREKLHERSQTGLMKYGCGLDRTDLSGMQWLIHLQQELMDAACYLERIMQYAEEGK